MRKSILSPVCSAVVVPGLGQITNGQTKKGLMILVIVFLLVIALILNMALVLKDIFAQMDVLQFSVDEIMNRLAQKSLGSLAYLTIAFLVVWVYAVLDALWVGIKLDRREGK